MKLRLTKDHPFITTENNVEVIKSTSNNTLTMIPERQFLEWITPYTGPLEQFRSSENFTLYFMLTASGPQHKNLYMTVFNLNRRIAVMLHWVKEELTYINATVVCNPIASEMEAR